MAPELARISSPRIVALGQECAPVGIVAIAGAARTGSLQRRQRSISAAREAAIARNLGHLSGMPCISCYRLAGGTLVSTKDGSVWRGLVRSFMGCSLMRPGALGALALLPAVAASRFNRLLIT